MPSKFPLTPPGVIGQLARSRVLNAIQQKQVFRRAPPGDRKSVSIAGAGVADFSSRCN